MLLRQSLFYLVSRGVTGVLSFVVLVLYTRILAPHQYGFYALAAATEALAFTLSFLAVCSSALRLAAGGFSDELRSGILAFYGLTAALLAAVLAAAMALCPASDRPFYAWIFVLLLAHGWLEINLHLQTARLRAGRYALANAARSIVSALVGAALVELGFGAEGALVGFLAGLLVPAMALSLTEWSGFRWRAPSRAALREIFRYGAPLSIGYALDALVYYSDRLVIAAFGGADAVGRYAAGFDLADKCLTAIMSAIGTAGFALALRFWERGDESSLCAQLKRNLAFLTALGLPAAVGLALLAPDLALLLGPGYRDSAQAIVPIIAVTIFFANLRGNYFDHAFHLSRRTTRLTWIVLASGIVNLGLNLLLVPRLGPLGAAWASLGALSLSLVLAIVVGRRVRPMPIPRAELLKAAACTAAMAVALAFFHPSLGILGLPVRAAWGALVYGGCALLCNLCGTLDVAASALHVGHLMPQARATQTRQRAELSSRSDRSEWV